ncbi:hypothetical protein GCM10022404_27490 [Celeribacter arenosi]|uniref:Uncharacterized protein n=1 Tax=Celeribacter arenosi TaxID=792649 RepID=A0ABP7KFX8_9RHOB
MRVNGDFWLTQGIAPRTPKCTAAKKTAAPGSPGGQSDREEVSPRQESPALDRINTGREWLN